MYTTHTTCRACGYAFHGAGGNRNPKEKLVSVFNLGVQPLANDFVKQGQECQGHAPLEVLFCEKCRLAQLSVVVKPEVLYKNYAYVTSDSETMRKHFMALVHDLTEEQPAGPVVEIGSNNGALLKHLRAEGFINSVGIEPAENLAREANADGVLTINDYLDSESAAKAKADCGGKVSFVLARHCFCHADSWVKMIDGFEALADKDTLIAIEVPYLPDQIANVSFDQCLPPGQMVVTSRGIVEIENVTTSDKVLTHLGEMKKVTHIFEHCHDGEVIKITAYGQNIPLFLTPEHPVYVSRNGKLRFIEAGHIKTGDRILKPCYEPTRNSEWCSVSCKQGNSKVDTLRQFRIDSELCKIFGYYLAEGYYYECKPGAAQVSFAFGKSESEKQLALECSRCLRWHKSKASLLYTKYGWRVTTYGAMARLLKQEFGTGAAQKNIPGWVFSLTLKLTEVLVRSYVEGDGYRYRNDQYWRASTVSLKLAQGISVLANRIGYSCSVNVGKVLAPRKIANNSTVSILTHPPIDILIRRKQTKKIKTWCDGTNQYSLVRKVERQPYVGPVHNLEVADDNSYTTIQGAVHNCYHEHLSYLSLSAMAALLEDSTLRMHKVIKYPIHGGCVLIMLRPLNSGRDPHPSVEQFMSQENITADTWREFAAEAHAQIHKLGLLIKSLRDAGKTVCGYGASAKSTVWVNACKFSRKDISFITDTTKGKWHTASPGTDIPITDPGALLREMPDYCILFAWNFAQEILAKESLYREKGGRFIIPVPHIKIV